MLKDITEEMDVGYVKAVYLIPGENVSNTEMVEFGKLIGESYNCSQNNKTASCFEWWPEDAIDLIPEGCYVALVRGHSIKLEHRRIY